jgi:hypothetical protein
MYCRYAVDTVDTDNSIDTSSEEHKSSDHRPLFKLHVTGKTAVSVVVVEVCDVERRENSFPSNGLAARLATSGRTLSSIS